MLDTDILQILKEVAALEGVPEEQLIWLIENGVVIHLSADDPLFKKGAALEYMYIVLSGSLLLKSEQANSFRTVGEIEAGYITGCLPYSRAKEAKVHAIALQDSTVLSLHKQHFPVMIRAYFELTGALVHFMTSRVREFTKYQQQNEKMMALGKLSAGLAHELNNPSAAVVRSSKLLKDNLAVLKKKSAEIMKIGLTREQIDQVTDAFFQHIGGKHSPDLPIAARSEREEELLEWLNEAQVHNADEIAEDFASYNFSLEDLERVTRQLPHGHVSPIFNWFHRIISMDLIVADINNAAQKINDLVLSVKRYTYMDQSPEKQPAEIHEGINNTLTILQHKLRKANIKVEKSFQQDLPRPRIRVSEFNQVWTNLIDNAIDALENAEKKKIIIKTSHENGYVKITITDTGCGIPKEDKDKIFDPFFTTKAVGKGTGLGLDLVQQVIQQHDGNIQVHSKPGETIFEVCIPIDK